MSMVVLCEKVSSSQGWTTDPDLVTVSFNKAFLDKAAKCAAFLKENDVGYAVIWNAFDYECYAAMDSDDEEGAEEGQVITNENGDKFVSFSPEYVIGGCHAKVFKDGAIDGILEFKYSGETAWFSVGLPVSTGQDAKWVLFDEAREHYGQIDALGNSCESECVACVGCSGDKQRSVANGNVGAVANALAGEPLIYEGEKIKVSKDINLFRFSRQGSPDDFNAVHVLVDACGGFEAILNPGSQSTRTDDLLEDSDVSDLPSDEALLEDYLEERAIEYLDQKAKDWNAYVLQSGRMGGV